MAEPINQSAFLRIAPDVRLGKNVIMHSFVNLYGCRIGDHTRLGTFIEIQKNATIGARCKISSHTFICEGVTIEDEVFVGHGVIFINDPDPRAATDGKLQTEADLSRGLNRQRRCDLGGYHHRRRRACRRGSCGNP
jgi:carbonic anhydrase/acetyltransferase-like protein (isoleucine patch superfamily)